jgi:hypothetical protein
VSGADAEARAVSLLRELGGTGEITPEMLMETFPRWRVFESGGIWWARRPGQQAADGPESLLQVAVGDRSLNGLADKLCLQEHLNTLTPDELTAVWRDAALPEAGRDEGSRR